MVVRGWGNKVFGFGKQRSAQILQELRGLKEIPLEDEENSTGCQTLLGNLIQLKSHHMRVWKEGPEPANGCQGNSGGPISRLHRSSITDQGHWVLAGIVSFGVTKISSRCYKGYKGVRS